MIYYAIVNFGGSSGAQKHSFLSKLKSIKSPSSSSFTVVGVIFVRKTFKIGTEKSGPVGLLQLWGDFWEKRPSR